LDLRGRNLQKAEKIVEVSKFLLFSYYCEGDGIRENKIGVAYSTDRIRHMYMQSFGRKPGNKCPPGRPRLRWKDNIKLDLKK
jgi:hypothetical protein